MKRSVALIGFLLLPTSIFAVSACSSLGINTSSAEEVTAESVLTQSSGQQLPQSNEAIELSPEAKKDLTEIAQTITVKISTQNNGGSGVLIGKQGNNYLILTNAHVVRGGKTFEIKTEDSQTHQANLVSNFISADYDLALLQFNSNRTYEVATLSELPVEPELIAFAAGYSAQTGKLVANSGQVARFPDQSLKNGYQIGYTSEIEQGMSGGPILDDEGELIGINGKGSFPIINTAYVYQDGTQPQPEEIEAMRQLSWGIPTNTVLGQLNSDLITAYNLPQPEIAEANTPALTGWLGELEAEAKQFTVKIDNTNGLSNGSGVIIAKEGNTYAVLTADHVICERDNATQPCRDFVYEIVTHDGQRHQIEANKTRREEGVDLAVVRFTSDENYQVAELANYPLTQGDAVFVAGYPKLDKNKPAPWLFSLGYGFDRETGLIEVNDNSLTVDNSGLISNQGSLSGGYEMAYSSITYGGMSGGAVLDRDGRVIGIHGLAEGETAIDSQSSDKKQIQIGYSLGIPINTFVGLTDRLKVNSALAIQNNKPKELNTAETQAFQAAILGTEIPQSNATAERWLERGNQLWRLRRYSEAVEAFDKSIALNPKFIHLAYYGKGLALLYNDEDEAALVSLELATKTKPDFAPAFLWKSVTLQKLNRLEKALPAIETASSLQPNNANLYNQKGWILLNLQHYAEAEVAYNQAIELNPRSAFYNNRGNLFYDQDKLKLALTDFNKALDLNPNLPEVYDNRGLLYAKLGKLGLALADHNKALDLDPNLANAYNNRGNLFYDQDKLKLALTDFNKALDLNPNLPEVYDNRGLLYAKLGKLGLALADHNKALDLDPNLANAYNNRGNIFYIQGKLELALADYNQALDLNPNLPEAYNGRGLLYAKLDKLKLALADFNKALDLNPNYAEAYDNRGLLFYFQDKLELALADFNKALDLNPNLPEAYNDRGLLYAKLGKLGLALADYNQALDLNPNYAEVYYHRGNIFYIQGKLELALADYNQALDLNPNYAEVYYHRGNIFHDQDRLELALTDYNKVVFLNKKAWVAHNNIGLIKYEMGLISEARQQFEQAININDSSPEPQLALAVTLYTFGEQEKALAMAEKALNIDKQFADTEFLKENLWGEKLITDTEKLLSHPQIQEFLARL